MPQPFCGQLSYCNTSIGEWLIVVTQPVISSSHGRRHCCNLDSAISRCLIAVPACAGSLCTLLLIGVGKLLVEAPLQIGTGCKWLQKHHSAVQNQLFRLGMLSPLSVGGGKWFSCSSMWSGHQHQQMATPPSPIPCVQRHELRQHGLDICRDHLLSLVILGRLVLVSQGAHVVHHLHHVLRQGILIPCGWRSACVSCKFSTPPTPPTPLTPPTPTLRWSLHTTKAPVAAGGSGLGVGCCNGGACVGGAARWGVTGGAFSRPPAGLDASVEAGQCTASTAGCTVLSAAGGTVACAAALDGASTAASLAILAFFCVAGRNERAAACEMHHY